MQGTSSYRGLYYEDMCDNKISRLFNHVTRPHENQEFYKHQSKDEQEQHKTGTYRELEGPLLLQMM